MAVMFVTNAMLRINYNGTAEMVDIMDLLCSTSKEGLVAILISDSQ